MRIVYMGTPDIAVPTLRFLAESKHEVVGVLTQPDRPKGRGHHTIPTPVKAAALEYDIPVYQPLSLRKGEDAAAALETLRQLAPDLIVVLAYGQLLPKEVLELPKYRCINLHASLLPAYRGAAPIQWVILNGETKTGVTAQQMAEGLDTGDMIMKTEIVLDEKETGGSLHDKLAEAGAKLCVETLKAVEDGTAVRTKQGETGTDYAKQLNKKMGDIDWTKPAVEIERLIRGLNPWPSAYTSWSDKTMKIWEAEVLDKESGQAPGTVAEVDKKTFAVQTGKGMLKILSLQLPGKKRMDTDAFLRGNQIKIGETL